MKALKSIFSGLLALLVLLSSLSLTINRHVCMGQVQSVAILHEAASCGMEQLAGMSTMEGCCQNQQTKIEGNKHQIKIIKPVAVEYQSLWVATLPALIETIDLESASAFISHTTYKPPLIEREIPVLIQSFLI